MEWHNLSWQRFFVLVLLLGMVVCPGFLGIFAFKPDLFTSLEFPKLLMLAMSLTVPVFALNVVLTLPYFRPEDATSSQSLEAAYSEAITNGAKMSMIALYLPILLRLIMEISWKGAVGLGLFIAVSGFLMLRNGQKTLAAQAEAGRAAEPEAAQG